MSLHLSNPSAAVSSHFLPLKVTTKQTHLSVDCILSRDCLDCVQLEAIAMDADAEDGVGSVGSVTASNLNFSQTQAFQATQAELGSQVLLELTYFHASLRICALLLAVGTTHPHASPFQQLQPHANFWHAFSSMPATLRHCTHEVSLADQACLRRELHSSSS